MSPNGRRLCRAAPHEQKLNQDPKCAVEEHYDAAVNFSISVDFVIIQLEKNNI